jgi:hypothetical protein
MVWPLKFAVAVLSVCLAVMIILGLCLTWGLVATSDSIWRILGTAGLGVLGAGFYIGVRDSLQRIKKG